MTKTNTQDNLMPPNINIPTYQPAYQDDEIDLRELLNVIWGYKWLTVALCTLAIIGSVFYALNAQEWWVAKGKVIAPQINEVAALYSQSKKVGAILNVSNRNNIKAKEIDEFISLFEPGTLFANFANAFNSSENKKLFLESNAAFLDYLKEKKVQLPNDDLTAENQLVRTQYRRVLGAWMNEISASFDQTTSSTNLSFRTPTKQSSSQLLNLYISFINQRVENNQIDKFRLFLDSAKQDLQTSLELTKLRVAQQLATLLQKTEYAYQIAEQSDLIEFQPNLNTKDELFQINLGKKALKAKIEVLKSIKDLTVFEPSIAEMEITLDALNKFKLVEDRSFTPFRYLETVEPPLNRAAPKRALIVILATLLAGMLSVFIALVHYFMTKKQDD